MDMKLYTVPDLLICYYLKEFVRPIVNISYSRKQLMEVLYRKGMKLYQLQMDHVLILTIIHVAALITVSSKEQLKK